MGKVPSYKKRERAENIAFGSEFKQRIKEIRSRLGIPEGGFPKDIRRVEGLTEKGFLNEVSFPPDAANEWYIEHIHQATGKLPESLPRNLPRYCWYFPREFAELIADAAHSNQPCRPGFYADVPLDQYAMDLVREFGLPEDAVNEVKRHILVEENIGFGVSPKLQPLIIHIEEPDELEFFVMIGGIDGSTTKKDWLDIWHKIQLDMDKHGEKIITAATKRDNDNISVRDLTWWKWSQEGRTLKEIANKWQTKHPKDQTYGEDTIAAAIKRIKKQMRPIH